MKGLLCVLGLFFSGVLFAQNDEVSDPISFDSQEEIFDFTDPQAQFPGGQVEMYKWIKTNFRYPVEALKDSISGKVFVQFVVEKSGDISNIIVLKTPSKILSLEAVRLMKAMPQWEPGKLEGKAVRSRYTLPIFFKLT